MRTIDSGSLSAAARNLNVSPAAAGNHVRALERWLGTRLLNRTTRKIALTEAGSAFLVHARRILEETEAAAAAASRLHAEPSGTLRVSAPVTFSLRVLAPVIADYLAAHARMRINLEVTDRVVDLIEDRLDCAIRIGDLADSTLTARRIGHAPFVICAAPSYLDRHGRPTRAEDLADHACLEYSLRPPLGRWQLVAPDGAIRQISVAGRLEASNGDVLRVAALRGLGLTLAPRFVIATELAEGSLIPVLEEYGLPAPGIFIVHASGRQATAKLRSFTAFLANRLGEKGLNGGGLAAAPSRRRPDGVSRP
ncbi:LysR substrate-binding domain-containing protein [Marinivivus vitaminiproducens]|uniref:LysR family transcriptional regulator n=1 Tax=Marinivivus vitaminiproducens TaxID=3035935 RepID=UPI0027989C6C|nr:LysR substrate-binding domain-containing protein [Geminicoccaceae bacterium SCSIO 64248]